MSGLTVVRTEQVDRSPRPRLPRQANLNLTAELLLIVALLLGWLVGYLLVFSDFQHGHAQSRLYDSFRTELALGEAPTAAPIVPGTPVAMIDLTGLRHEVVVEGSTPALLQSGVGHVTGSVLPGQAGVSVLMGRSLTFGAPFGHLGEMRIGDPIVVRTQQGEFTYRVSGLRRAGDLVPAPVAAGAGRLTLVTGWGGGPLSAANTLYVDADLQGKAVAAAAAGFADPAGAPMASDTGVTTLALLALALQLLIAAVFWLVWARARWSHLGAWVTGVPLVIAALWLVTSLVSRMLPNLV